MRLDSLRVRSPFSITAIVWVGARVRDGGGTTIFMSYLSCIDHFSGPHSEVQKTCLAHAERLGTYLASKGNSSADVLLT